MPVTKSNVLYCGEYVPEMLIEAMKSFGTSINGGWINAVQGVKPGAPHIMPKVGADVDPAEVYDCDLPVTTGTTYEERQLEVFKYMVVDQDCNDVFVNTMGRKAYADGGLASIPESLLKDYVIAPITRQLGKQFGKAIWQAVSVGATPPAGSKLTDIFDGFETQIVTNAPGANVLTGQAAITSANVLAELDAFLEHIEGIANSEDWFYPADNLTNANFPAVWVDKATWSKLKRMAYSADFKDMFDFGATSEAFVGSYKGYTIYADLLTEGTMIAGTAGEGGNFHVGVDATMNGEDSEFRVEPVPNTNKFQIDLADSVGTLVTLPSQVALRQVAV
ncbi:hypothetical protein N9251_03445 [Gammaproteobacteria bacterium]|nr:hypothetical protein [Gammaproteobacteria bacterium]